MILFFARMLIARNPAMTLPYAKRIVKIFMVTIALVVAVIAFMVWLDAREKAAVAANRAFSNTKALSTAREADERAERAGNRTIEEISDANERAKAAADAGSDPLGDGLRSLRAEKDRDR